MDGILMVRHTLYIINSTQSVTRELSKRYINHTESCLTARGSGASVMASKSISTSSRTAVTIAISGRPFL